MFAYLMIIIHLCLHGGFKTFYLLMYLAPLTKLEPKKIIHLTRLFIYRGYTVNCISRLYFIIVMGLL